MSANNLDPNTVAGEQARRADLAVVNSIGRRRALLQGVGKAAAIAGAALPIRTLAGDKGRMTIKTGGGNGLQCTLSGSMSKLASTAHQHPECRGNNVSYYCKDINGKYPGWPKDKSGNPVCTVGAVNHSKDKVFSQIFGTGPTYANKSISWIIDNQPSSDEARWVVAMLNATVRTASFPYSTSEVQQLFVNSDDTRRKAAAQFFRTYLEG